MTKAKKPLEKAKGPRGRPRRYIGDRPNWTIRLEEKYGSQIREIAEKLGRSISDICSERIVMSFRAEIVIDLLEKKNLDLIEECHNARTASKAVLERLYSAENRVEDLTNRIERILRNRTKQRFGRPTREKKSL